MNYAEKLHNDIFVACQQKRRLEDAIRAARRDLEVAEENIRTLTIALLGVYGKEEAEVADKEENLNES